MAFEVRPVAVGRPLRRGPTAALLAVLAVIAGAAFVTADDGPGDGGGVGEAAALGVAAPSGAGNGPVASPLSAADGRAARRSASLPSRPLPARIDCRDLDRTVCLRVARAALAAVPPDAPPVIEATVWRSLLCSDTLECPSRYFEDSVPLGSAILRFTDGGPRAAINVVDWQPAAGIGLGPRAWLARWMPDAGS